jgi:DNA-binding NtrC family response regulator
MSPTANDPSSAPSVLVVDDDPSTRVLLKKIFNRAGYTVDLASGGAEGLNLALSRQYGAILVDLVMPQPDGQAMLRVISDITPALLRKIITLSVYPKQLVAGTFATLIKPLDISEVLRLTRRCIDSQ